MRIPVLILGHSYATQFIDIYNQYTKLFNTEHYQVTVAYLTGEENQEVKARTLAEIILFLNFPKKKIRYLKIQALFKMLTLCRANQFQIVICHRYKPSYLMMWVAQFYKMRALFFVMHELKTMSSLNRQLLIACLHRKNMIFAGVSNAVRDDMRKSLWCLKPERIITLYNMIDVEMTESQLFSREEAKKRLQLPQDTFIFGHIARLAPNKNQTHLIRAFALIKQACPRSKLIIMGEGALESQLKVQVAHAHLTSDVIFTGFLPQANRYMKAFDCFVLSSIQEAFGRVLLEAMVAKLPIIATRTHGIPEVVAPQGTLVEPNDVESMATAMKRLYQSSHQALATEGEINYQHAINHFSISCFQQTFWQLPLMHSLET